MKKAGSITVKVIFFVVLLIFVSKFLQPRYRYLEISNVVTYKNCNVSFAVKNTTRKTLVATLLISINRRPTKMHSGGSKGSKQVEVTLLPQDEKVLTESLVCSGLASGGVADILILKIQEVNS